MSEFKGMKEKVGIINQDEDRISMTKGAIDCWSGNCADGVTNEEMQANAELIVEAFEVRQQIPFTLTELKRQRDELLGELKIAVKALGAVSSMGATKPIIERWEQLIESVAKIK